MDASDPNSQKQFFYLAQDQMLGPLELVDLAAELRLGNIGKETPVRQQDEAAWTPFCERPEFTLATEMPVETIARHLEAKERATDAPTPSGSWLTSGMGITVIAFFIGAFALFWVMSVMSSVEKTTANSSLAPWIKTEENGFSVEAPVPLQRVMALPDKYAYQGINFGAVFHVDLEALPEANYTDDQYDILLSKYENAMSKNLQATVTSSRDITVNGYHGQDILLSRGNAPYASGLGGARFLAGNKTLLVAWVWCKNANFEGDITRFLNSCQLQ